MEILKRNEGPEMENIIRGSLWTEKNQPDFPGKLVMPLICTITVMIQVTSGAHSGTHQMSGCYYNVPRIPPRHQSALENIFVASITYASDCALENECAFRKVLDEILFLEKEGVTIVVNETETQVYFALTLVLGDNLRVAEVTGTVPVFVSNIFCRKCKMHRNDTRRRVRVGLALLRTPENYEADLAIDDVSLTGMRCPCIWNGYCTLLTTAWRMRATT